MSDAEQQAELTFSPEEAKEIAHVFADFRQALREAGQTKDQLEAAGIAASGALAIAQKLTEIGALSPGENIPLLRLVEGLFDMWKRGTAPSWLAPRIPEGKDRKRRVDLHSEMSRAHASAAVTFLMKTMHGRSKLESACQRVAEQLGVSWESVRAWRERLCQQRGDEEASRRYYTILRNYGNDPAGAAEKLLQALKEET